MTLPSLPTMTARTALASAAALLALLAAAAGPAAAKVLTGTRGADSITGTRGPDRIFLRAGADLGFGVRGADLVRGNRGGDRLRGGRGEDRLLGGPGADLLRGDAGADRLLGGPGGDTIRARDAHADRVDGGRGFDICVLDGADAARARGCENVLPAPGGTPAAKALGVWEPGAFDTCPRSLHASFAVIGPGGKRYPTWHPPRVIDPASGEPCTFGHEHGRDPRGSDLYRWVRSHLVGAGGDAGIPFGVANEALDSWAASNPGAAIRHEDHVGHKIEWQNDVALERRLGGSRVPIGVRCDFLTKLHQGTHSKDALGNNVHELIYAVRCTDGTELLATELAAFGAPDEFVRSCDPATVVAAGTDNDYPAGGGARLIPDRSCVEEHILVASGQSSRYSLGLYEDWISSNRLRTAGGRLLAHFDPHFAVFNPSRYADLSLAGGLGREIDACFEVEPNGDRARGGYCERAHAYGPLPYDDPRSGFDGAHREVWFNQTEITNRDGPRRWYTDPYGGNASTTPFPGAICQLVGPTDNSRAYPLASERFGAGRDYGGEGVHAPN